MNDIMQVTNLKKKDLSRDYRLLLFELDLKSPVIDPVKCVAKIANITCVSEWSKREAIDVMNNIIRLGMATGKHLVLQQTWSIYRVTKKGKVELKRKLLKQLESQR